MLFAQRYAQVLWISTRDRVVVERRSVAELTAGARFRQVGVARGWSKAMPPSIDHDELIRRLSRDLEDSYDEELETELEDRHPTGAERAEATPSERDERRRYFR